MNDLPSTATSCPTRVCAKFVVVGGGLAGVTCALSLKNCRGETPQVLLVSTSPRVKSLSNWRQVGACGETFSIDDRSGAEFLEENGIEFIASRVVDLDPAQKRLTLENGTIVEYDRLCLALGATPKTIPSTSKRVLTLRDDSSAAKLARFLRNSQKILIIGSGGIATELGYRLSERLHVIWAIRELQPTSAFLPSDMAEILKSELPRLTKHSCPADGSCRRSSEMDDDSTPHLDAAIGPNWTQRLNLDALETSATHGVELLPNCEILSLEDDVSTGRIVARTASGEQVRADAVIIAIGVEPNVPEWAQRCCRLASDGGIAVDERMRTSCDSIWAAGDCATIVPKENTRSELWHQQRLWQTARQMGDWSAQTMRDGEEALAPLYFELFEHATHFYGYPVMLLGAWRSSPSSESSVHCRDTVRRDGIARIVTRAGRLIGAVLVGESATELAETLENLMLNGTDISEIEHELLAENHVDVDDFFD